MTYVHNLFFASLLILCAVPLAVAQSTARDDLSSTDFALAVGGGVDVRVSERVAVRVFQIDYNAIFLDNFNELGFPKMRADNVRFSFGVVFR